MPEGPSIVLLREAITQFAGKKIIAVSGNSKIDQSLLPFTFLDQQILHSC